MREVVYQRALPLATRKLTITTTQLGAASALHGAVALATGDVFSERGIARLLVEDHGLGVTDRGLRRTGATARCGMPRSPKDGW